MYPNEKIFIFDPMRQYNLQGFQVAYDACTCGDLFLQGAARVAMVCAPPSEGAEMFDILRELNDILVVYDEADMILDTQHNPEAFQWLVSYGRHCEQGMILIARRPQRLPREFTAQSILFFGDTVEPNDTAYIKARIGKEPDKAGEFCWYAHDFDGSLIHIDKNFSMN
jgi:hypothetical protein